MWGIGAYLGYNLFTSAFDKVSGFVNSTSSGLASFLNPAGVGNYTDAEATRVWRVFNTLDSGIADLRRAEQANSAAFAGLMKRLQEGQIESSEFQIELEELMAEEKTFRTLRLELLFSRDVVTYIRNEFNYDRGGIPEWFDTTSYRDIIEACKGYPLPEGTGITPLPTTE